MFVFIIKDSLSVLTILKTLKRHTINHPNIYENDWKWSTVELMSFESSRCLNFCSINVSFRIIGVH